MAINTAIGTNARTKPKPIATPARCQGIRLSVGCEHRRRQYRPARKPTPNRTIAVTASLAKKLTNTVRANPANMPAANTNQVIRRGIALSVHLPDKFIVVSYKSCMKSL